MRLKGQRQYKIKRRLRLENFHGLESGWENIQIQTPIISLKKEGWLRNQNQDPEGRVVEKTFLGNKTKPLLRNWQQIPSWISEILWISDSVCLPFDIFWMRVCRAVIPYLSHQYMLALWWGDNLSIQFTGLKTERNSNEEAVLKEQQPESLICAQIWFRQVAATWTWVWCYSIGYEICGGLGSEWVCFTCKKCKYFVERRWTVPPSSLTLNSSRSGGLYACSPGTWTGCCNCLVR